MSIPDRARARPSDSDRIPTPEQLKAICLQARRYIDVRRRRLAALPSGDSQDLMHAESLAGLGLKKALDDSEAACPYGWPDPVRDALAALWRVAYPPAEYAVGGSPDCMVYGPTGIPYFITSRPDPVLSSWPIPREDEELNALEAAVAELDEAVSGDLGDALQAAVSPPVANPEQPAALSHDGPAGWLDRVTLDQAAAIVHMSKRTLERYKTKGELPAPVVEGGGGRADLYDWRVMKPWRLMGGERW